VQRLQGATEVHAVVLRLRACFASQRVYHWCLCTTGASVPLALRGVTATTRHVVQSHVQRMICGVLRSSACGACAHEHTYVHVAMIAC
jgi:hypothetical protein